MNCHSLMNLCVRNWGFLAETKLPRFIRVCGSLIFLSIGSGTGNVARAQSALPGDLFSGISMSHTVASSTANTGDTRVTSDVVLGGVMLAKLLSSDGIESSLQAQTVVIELASLDPNQTNEAGGTLRLNVDAEGERIDVLLPLSTKTADLSATDQSLQNLMALRKLMIAMSAHPNVQLVATDASLALHSSISNRNVSSDKVRDVAIRLRTAAAETKTLKGSSSAPSPVEPNSPHSASAAPIAPTSTVTSGELSLTGTWSAKTSATEAWAVRFADDQSFVLVHHQGTKSSVSRGRFNIAAGQLRLSETSGVSLDGRIDWDSANAFSWQLQDKSGRSLMTLEFKKQ